MPTSKRLIEIKEIKEKNRETNKERNNSKMPDLRN